MIQIVNIGGNPEGVSDYSLRINGREMCRFQHDRPNGLSVCLRKAADAYDRQREVEMIEYFRAIANANDTLTPCAETGKVTTRSKPKRKLLDRAESLNEDLQDSRV